MPPCAAHYSLDEQGTRGQYIGMNRLLNTPFTKVSASAPGFIRLAAFMLLAGLLLHAPAMAAEAVGSVEAAKGQCRIIRGGDTLAAETGGPVMLDDAVTTGPGAEMTIVFADETVLTLAESSRAAIDGYVYSDDAANLLFKFTKGTFRTITGEIVKRNPEGFNMETPLATIGIRGSDVYAVITPDGEETGALHLGENHALEVKTAMQTVRITESGLRVRISPAGLIFTPTRIPPSMFNSMLRLGSAAPAAPEAPEAAPAKSAPASEKSTTSPTMTKSTSGKGSTSRRNAPTLEKTAPRMTPLQKTEPTVTPTIKLPVRTTVPPPPPIKKTPPPKTRIIP